MAEFKVPCSLYPDRECPSECPVSLLNPDMPKQFMEQTIAAVLEDLDASTNTKNDINDPEVRKLIFNVLSEAIKTLQQSNIGPPRAVVEKCIS